MFPFLASAIETLQVPHERDALVSIIGLRDRLDAKITEAVGAYRAAGLHEIDGSVTMASWLSHRAGLDPEAARRCDRRAARLHQLPVLRAAQRTGLLSAGAVDVVLAKLPNRHVARFAQHEAELVPILADLDIAGVAAAMRDWRAKADALDPGPAPADLPDTVHLSSTLEDRGAINGTLGTDLYNVVATAFRVADPGDLSLPLARRHAIAFGQICQTFLDLNPSARHRRHRPHLNITMTYEQWADRDHPGTATYLDTGMPVSRDRLDILRCDAAWHRLTYGDRAALLRYGRTMRDWPVDLYNAIALRDGGCRWPGCTAPVHWCDVHHVHFWEHGGHTDSDNGLLLCRRHHHALHRKDRGFSLKLLPDGTAELTHADGSTETSAPRGLDPPRLPLPDH